MVRDVLTVFAFVGVIFLWVLFADDAPSPRTSLSLSPPPYPVFAQPQIHPETGDLGVLRLVVAGSVRGEIEAAVAEPRPIGETVGSVAKILLAHRDAWHSAGAVDADTCRLFDVPARYALILAAELERIAVLDEWRAAPDLGPFRSVQSDPREVMVIVIALGVRESPVLRAVDMETLVTIGEIGRGDTVAAALETFTALGDRILMGQVVIRNTHAGDLLRAFSREDLVSLTS